jgi:hypothetical protein
MGFLQGYARKLGVMEYLGVWDASTNTPNLTSGVGQRGGYYIVSVAGSTELDSLTDWGVGDWVVFNGTTWEKIDNSEAGYTREEADIKYTEAQSRENHTGVQLSSTISDFVESVHSSVASLFGEGNDISFIYPDENGKIQALLNATGVTAGSYNTFTVDSRGRIIAASNTENGNVGSDIQITSEINSTTLTTYSDIVGLETGVLLPGLYRFTFMGLANSTSTSTGIGVKLGVSTANISTIYGKYAITQSVPGTTQSYEYDQISQNTNVTSTSSVSTYFSFVIQGEGVVRVLTSGTLVMKFRSEVNGSAVSINPDSILKLEKL